MEDGAQFDFIIVGAGSAGCVLAERLSSSGSFRILLVEAGRSSKDPWLHIPAGYYRNAYGPKHNWSFKTEPIKELNGRSVPWPRGKGLGGSSLINGLIYIRGQKEDFDQWAQLGNRGWSYDDVLPYFMRSEGFEGEPGRFHGKDGPLAVGPLRMKHVLHDAFVQAAVQSGYPANPDFNGETQEGAGIYQLTVGRWFRSSTSNAFLTRSVKRRPNLKIITGCLVNRINFEGTTATGVLLSLDGAEKRIIARREVIVAAGAINSPQLLQLSGVGPAPLLATHGIDVVVDRPGVGENLQDHLSTRMTFRVKGLATINEIYHSVPRKLAVGLEYLLFRRGLLMAGGGPVGLFAKSDPAAATPDVQYHFFALSQDAPIHPPHKFPGCMISCVPCRPESRGWIRIRSSDPRDPPRIQPNYLATENDKRKMIEGVKIARRVTSAPALAKYLEHEILPGPAVQSDNEWLGFIRERSGTAAHPVSSCKMGNDPMSVVDDELKVHGAQKLRVVDASIMPMVVSGNTNAATIMIAEKGADLILGDVQRS